MNQNALIAQLTAAVMSELSATPPAAPVAAQTFLVVATSANEAPGVIDRIRSLPGKNRIVLAVPKYARSLIGNADLAPASVQFLDFGKPDEAHLLAGTDIVVLPTLDPPLLAKVSQYRTDTWPSRQVVTALATGKPVFVPGKGTESWAAKARQLGILVGGWELLISQQARSGTGDCDNCPTVGHCATRCPDKVGAMLSLGAGRLASPHDQTAIPLSLAKYIDHTLLKPDATEKELLKLCREARENKFASVCVNPGWVKLCADQLKGSGVMVCTVVGFPLGATTTAAKVAETHKAIADGADEIDMVLNIGALKSGAHDLVEQDIRAVKQACGRHTLKVIFETALLKDDEKVVACERSVKAGADFVKTSTGFVPGGATVHDISLMRKTVGPELGVKASGGVRDYATAVKMVEAGANRIGASASVAIVKGGGASGKGNY